MENKNERAYFILGERILPFYSSEGDMIHVPRETLFKMISDLFVNHVFDNHSNEEALKPL